MVFLLLKTDRIFPTTYGIMQNCFNLVRKRAATNLQNPRLRKIHFTTFRHWGGTKIAHITHGNVLAVKKALGHKNIKNTMKYIHLNHFEDSEFEVATATTIDEMKQLAAKGFEKFDEAYGIHIFRKPKEFTS